MKILYIMGIDWGWIFQRPQIMAQLLSKKHDVTVVFPRSITVKDQSLPLEEGLQFRILKTIPYQEKNKLIGWFSNCMNRKVFRDIHDFDVIYIGYPMYGRYIPKDYQGRILYDCMDDQELLYPDQKRVERLVTQEKALLSRCHGLLVSAEKLAEKMTKINPKLKPVLVRNGVKIQKIQKPGEAQVKKSYKIGYTGTIAEWFDYDAVVKSLERLPSSTYSLIGPAKITREHERIQYTGPVAHEKLPEMVEPMDCLVMPFLLNDIVTAVDPVKLYEYIAFGKCIVSVYYPEIERFGDYVYFYKTSEEYASLMEELAEKGFPAKYNATMQEAFLAENTWEKRSEQVEEIFNRWYETQQNC